MSLIIELPEQIEQLMKLEADREGVSVEAYAAARLTSPYERAIAEWQEALNSPRRAYDADMIYRRYCEKYNLEDLSALNDEELADYADAALDKMTPEQIAEAKRLGMLGSE